MNKVEVTAEENIERWQNALRVLEQMPQHEREHHFQMSTWGINTACGTIACAAGHCGLDPWFQERGFILRKCTSCVSKCDQLVLSIEAEDFFDDVGANEIFYDGNTRTVEVVIEEIKTHIADLQSQLLDP